MSVPVLVLREQRKISEVWREAYRREAEEYRREAEALAMTTESLRDISALPTKCESCGSSEFRHHGGRHICAYCRSAS